MTEKPMRTQLRGFSLANAATCTHETALTFVVVAPSRKHAAMEHNAATLHNECHVS